MKNVKLIRRAFEVDEHLVLRTPQVQAAIQQMITILQTGADPLVQLSGLSGSGVSTVLSETSRSLDGFNGVRCFKLARPDLDNQYLPTEYLLRHFGFQCLQSTGIRDRTKLPSEVVALGSMLKPSILLVEDFMAGALNIEQKRTHISLWKQLAEPPLSLRIVLAGPSDQIKGAWTSHQPNGYIIHINEWLFNESFYRYLNDISLLSSEALKLDANLSHHAKSLYKLSRGNTARLLAYIRECAKTAIFSLENGISDKVFKMSFQQVVSLNAKLYNQLAGR